MWWVTCSHCFNDIFRKTCMPSCTVLYLLYLCVPPHLPSSVTEVLYPCGRVICKSTVGLSMFSLASVPVIPPPSTTGFLKMCRGAGWGTCGGSGARAFILLLKGRKKNNTQIWFVVLCIWQSSSRLQHGLLRELQAFPWVSVHSLTG